MSRLVHFDLKPQYPNWGDKHISACTEQIKHGDIYTTDAKEVTCVECQRELAIEAELAKLRRM